VRWRRCVIPIYEFKCKVCGCVKENLIPMSHSYINKMKCSDCGGDAIKIPSVSSFELKGGGWYDSGYSK